jgi:amidase
MPLAPSLDTVGWFTRDIDTFEKVGAVLLGPDRGARSLKRMILAEDAWAAVLGADELAAVEPAVGAVRRRLGDGLRVTLAPEGLQVWRETFKTVQGYEAWRAHGAWIEKRKPNLMPAVRARFEAGKAVTDMEYEAGVARRAEIRGRLVALLGEDGVLVQPTLPTIAPLTDAGDDDLEAFRARALSMLCIAGLAGLPQISLPMARVIGCPVGFSLIGPHGSDRALIALGRAILAG